MFAFSYVKSFFLSIIQFNTANTRFGSYISYMQINEAILIFHAESSIYIIALKTFLCLKSKWFRLNFGNHSYEEKLIRFHSHGSADILI